MKVLAVDPANEDSAYVLLDKETYKPLEFGKIKNEELLSKLEELEYDVLAIEMIASYGMPVGREVFETCVFIGRCIERSKTPYEYVYRKEEKLCLCNSMKAKDSNIRQALIDRFGEVGTKARKGFFYGFANDMWAAMAVGVTYIDRSKGLC